MTKRGNRVTAPAEADLYHQTIMVCAGFYPAAAMVAMLWSGCLHKDRLVELAGASQFHAASGLA
jgi:hypothetical protein